MGSSSTFWPIPKRCARKVEPAVFAELDRLSRLTDNTLQLVRLEHLGEDPFADLAEPELEVVGQPHRQGVQGPVDLLGHVFLRDGTTALRVAVERRGEGDAARVAIARFERRGGVTVLEDMTSA